MKIDRRHFLAAMGIGGAALTVPGAILGRPSRVFAQSASGAPKRVIFWITPHGTVWRGWNMTPPGLAPTGTGTASLVGLPSSAWSSILAPLAPHAPKLTVVEGLARITALEYERAHANQGGYDLNRHGFGRANLLTCVEPVQRGGGTCAGGGASIDQVIGRAVTEPGRWASRVYGYAAYSYVAPGEESARVDNARRGFDDIVAAYQPPASGGGETRADRIARARGSVLDFAASEHQRFAARLAAADRLKLERHRDLIRELELSFSAEPAAPIAECSPSWTDMGHDMDRYARVMALALSCDLTRVATFVTPDLAPPEIGLPPGTDVHQDYAHNSIPGSSAVYTAEGERGMIEYNRFYAQRFAYLLQVLDSIPEGNGSVLDNTAVVWTSELSTGAHDLHDSPIVIGGGAGGALRTGRYIRYSRDVRIASGWGKTNDCGPANSRLYVSLMRAMGMPNDSFGIDTAPRVGGGTVSLRDPLPELMAG